jgi:hypothetical protein
VALLKETEHLAGYSLCVHLTIGVEAQLFQSGVHNLPSRGLAACNDWKLPHINNQYSALKGFTGKKNHISIILVKMNIKFSHTLVCHTIHTSIQDNDSDTSSCRRNNDALNCDTPPTIPQFTLII